MSRRIEVELTSVRDDGTWTWRAAGARQPKGELDGGLLYPGAKVGDVVRADADFNVDGIVVTAVQPPKAAREEKAERIEVLGPPRRTEGGVTTQLAPKGRGRGERDGRRGDRDRGDRDRGDRGDRRERRGPRPDGDRRPRGEGREGRDTRRPSRPPRPAPEPRPKAPRLRAGRQHRNTVLGALNAEHKPLAELLLRGGIPEVRTALDRQNALLKADGKTAIAADPILDLAGRLMPALRAAEWRDRAEAALAQVDTVDLRDLRSVVAAADAAGRDEEARALADQLRSAVDGRVDREHAAWLAEIDENLREGRVVRALRLSSRPPKAGAPFPAELAQRLAAAASESLTADTFADRFALVLDAVALSPVRMQVTAASVPAEPSAELLGAVRKLAGRLPQIAAQFGITPVSA